MARRDRESSRRQSRRVQEWFLRLPRHDLRTPAHGRHFWMSRRADFNVMVLLRMADFHRFVFNHFMVCDGRKHARVPTPSARMCPPSTT